jgi:hypothetical protein
MKMIKSVLKATGRQESAQGIELIRAKLIKAEQGGFVDQTPKEILKDIKNGFGHARK